MHGHFAYCAGDVQAITTLEYNYCVELVSDYLIQVKLVLLTIKSAWGCDGSNEDSGV